MEKLRADDTSLDDTAMLNSQVQFRLTRCDSLRDEVKKFNKTKTQVSGLDEAPRYTSISDRPLLRLPDDSASHDSASHSLRLSTTVSNLEASMSPTPVTSVRDVNTRWYKIKQALQRDRHPSVEEEGYVNEGLGPQAHK